MNKLIIDTAVKELKATLRKNYGGEIDLKIFGSAARGDYTRYSDIDILVLLPGKVDNSLEEKIIDAAYDIELKYNVVFGIIVYGKEFWFSELAACMPLYRNIQRDGVAV